MALSLSCTHNANINIIFSCSEKKNYEIKFSSEIQNYVCELTSDQRFMDFLINSWIH